MHLVHPDDLRRVQTEGPGGAFAIGQNGGGVVSDRAAEVELLVRSGARSAPPVGEGEVRAARRGQCVVLSYHFKKSGTSSSSAWESWYGRAVGTCGGATGGRWVSLATGTGSDWTGGSSRMGTEPSPPV